MIAAAATELVPLYLPSPEISSDAGAVVSFGETLPNAVAVPLRQFGPERLAEVWNVRPGQVIFGSMSAVEDMPLEVLARDLYTRLIGDVRAAGYPYFLRMWNHVGSINENEGGTERYQLFCAGRHDAFVRAGYHHGADLPSASAVGMPGRGIVTYFIAARTPGLQIENPRQVAAYDYPARYGRKSPSFSRATLWNETLFVSGTSSVVGHASVHSGDLDAQIEETLKNIDVVVAHALAGGGLHSVAAAKTYVRHAAHFERVAARLERVFPANLFLQADICRSELLLEIEAVALR